MAEHSTIEWTDATWNPITGCSVVSPGCTHCYAMGLAGTRLRHHPSRAGLTRDTKAGPVWTGEVRLNEEWLDQPLRWKRPRRIFVCAHGDLFHEKVPDEWIDRVFAVMQSAKHHSFQVLTKRPARMRAYLSAFLPSPPQDGFITRGGEAAASGPYRGPVYNPARWPLPNVWLGVSVERQQEADQRIPDLLNTPAAVRFISAEPLLGRVALAPHWLRRAPSSAFLSGKVDWSMPSWTRIGAFAIDWVIAGGESGPHARPSHPDWFRSLRDQCQAAGVPFFFKQWGEWAPVPEGSDEARAAFPHNGWQMLRGHEGPIAHAEELYPEGGAVFVARVGKKAAGALLDGREWREMPR